MTKQEFLEQYGEEEVKFSSYYKYDFFFKNNHIKISIGGNTEDIYRLHIDTTPVKIQDGQMLEYYW